MSQSRGQIWGISLYLLFILDEGYSNVMLSCIRQLSISILDWQSHLQSSSVIRDNLLHGWQIEWRRRDMRYTVFPWVLFNEIWLKVGVLHGDLSVEDRAKSIQQFKDGVFKVLVTTNVCARGQPPHLLLPLPPSPSLSISPINEGQ